MSPVGTVDAEAMSIETAGADHMMENHHSKEARVRTPSAFNSSSRETGTLSWQSQPLEGKQQPAHTVISTLSSGSLKVNGEVNGVPLALLIDTGSPVTLISSDIWERLHGVGNLTLEPWNGQQFVGVNGSPLTVRGCFQASLNVFFPKKWSWLNPSCQRVS